MTTAIALTRCSYPLIIHKYVSKHYRLDAALMLLSYDVKGGAQILGKINLALACESWSMIVAPQQLVQKHPISFDLAQGLRLILTLGSAEVGYDD